MRTRARIVLVGYATHLKQNKTRVWFGWLKKITVRIVIIIILITSQRAVRDIDAPNAHIA
jgi:succinate dehydrogenase hydrophobic anchor subunit